MKYIITLIFAIVFQMSYSQSELEFYRSFDDVNISNKHPIDWRVRKVSSIGLKIRIPYKKFMIGGAASFSIYDLHRPSNLYEMEMSKFAMSISRSFQLRKKMDLLLEIYPYGRHFNTDFFSASMVVDKFNFGLGSYTGLRYNFSKKFKCGIGYYLEKDLLRSAIDSSEIIDMTRFINMMVNSLSISLTYTLNKNEVE